MIYIAALALDRAGAIGLKGGLPWPRLPKDFTHFKAVTMGRSVLMGRKTWQSIGRPLPGRQVIVLSSTLDGPLPAGVHLARDMAHAEHIAAQWGDTCVVAGGADLYADLLPRCSRLHLTRVHGVFAADTFAPWSLRAADGPPLGWRDATPPVRHEAEGQAPAFTIHDLTREGSR